jgi:hypothetical protein
MTTTTTTTTAFAAAVSAAAAAAAFLRDAFVAAEAARAEAGYTAAACAAADTARVAALTAVFAALKARGLRERPARRALAAAVETAGVHVGYLAPRDVGRPMLVKRTDVLAARRYGHKCPCASCNGDWWGDCEADPVTWAYARHRMRAARRAALASRASLAVSL